MLTTILQLCSILPFQVGDNTFPNLIPLLTGYAGPSAYNICKPTTPGGLDNCNFIWTNMSEHGFITAYAEDSASMSTFNYLKKGFTKLPTDYYFRPTAMALEKTMKTQTKSGLKYCVGRHQAGEYIYDYGVEFAKRFQNQSHFGLFWTNSFSHNGYSMAATMDDRMRQYLEDLKIHRIMETSIIFFFSDHGARWGPLLDLPEGFLEERLPMFFVYLPKWFKQEHPEFARNLEINQRRLATPFDIYMTLQHMLHLASPTYNITPAFDCAQAQSILLELPEDRACETACIPEGWCTCIPYMTQRTNNAMVKNVTQLVIDKINDYLTVKNISSICSELSLKKISRATLRGIDHESHSPNNIATYRIDFTTKPDTDPQTKFSAVADYDTKRKMVTLNVEDISRQSAYEKTAKCTDDKQAKKYCICKSYFKSKH